MNSDKKIGITGGDWLIGKALRQNLSSPVKFITRHSANEKLKDSETCILGNFADEKNIKHFVKDLDILIHTAAVVGPRGEFEIDFVRNDLVGSIELAKLFFKENPHGHFVFLSTAGGLYNLNDTSAKVETSEIFPDNIYGAVKYLVESALEGLGNVSVLRPAPVYGDSLKKNQKIGLIDKLLKTTLPEYTSVPVDIFDNLNSSRDYLHVNDLVEAILVISTKKAHNNYEVYNVGTGLGTSISSVISMIEKITSKRVSVNIIPVDKIATSLVINSNKIFQEYGWKPKKELIDGIAEMYIDLQKKEQVLNASY